MREKKDYISTLFYSVVWLEPIIYCVKSEIIDFNEWAPDEEIAFSAVHVKF